MISIAPTHALVAEPAVHGIENRWPGFGAWFLDRFQQSLCALRGHDAILQYERTRIFLRCTSCGHETPGWEVAANSTMLRHRPVEARPSLAPHGELRVARKIA